MSAWDQSVTGANPFPAPNADWSPLFHTQPQER